jgi:hypothetical protein
MAWQTQHLLHRVVHEARCGNSHSWQPLQDIVPVLSCPLRAGVPLRQVDRTPGRHNSTWSTMCDAGSLLFSSIAIMTTLAGQGFGDASEACLDAAGFGGLGKLRCSRGEIPHT